MRSLLSLFRTLSFRYLLKRRNRAGLIILSIAAGVAMLVSTQLLNHCIDAAASESTTPGTERADLVVTSNRRVRLDLLPELRKLPGVQSAQPLIFERVVLPEFGNRTAVLLGLDVQGGHAGEQNAFNAKLDITNPLAMLSGRGVVIGRELALALSPDGKPTKPFEIRAGGALHKLEPVGTVTLEGKAAKLGGFLLVMDVNQAARSLGQDGLAERIDLYLQPGANRDEVKRAAEEAVAGRAEVLTPDDVGKGSRDIVSGIRIGPTLCGIGAMVVGLFLIYNALAVNVAERRHDIGVLRSMGASRPQIACLFTAEAVVLGLIGALLGAPLGTGMARILYRLVQPEMEQLFLTANQPLDLTPELFFLAVGAGVATAVLAALVPAMSAASDEPADAVRRAPSGAAKFFRTLQAFASLALVGSGFSVVLVREYLPRRVGGYGGMVCLLIGLLLGVPLLVGVMSRLLQPLARWLFGIEARLASDNLLRAPGRTGVVVGALAAGVALMMQTAGIGRSNEEPILDWLDRVVSADLFVICGDPSASSAMLPIRPETVAQLRAVPGVEQVMTLRYSAPDYDGRMIWITALDAQVYHDTNRHASQLPHLDLFPKLTEPNTCLISENFAALHKVSPGETISIQGPNGPVPLKVLGAIQEYSWSRGSLVVDRKFYADAFDDHLIDGVHVFLKPGPDQPAARKRVKEFCDANALAVLTHEELNGYLMNFIKRLYTFAYMQQLAVGVVAALGVVMALLISVLQRRRELGLLRAVGATQGQVLHTVLAEATLMGAFGTILGVLAGIPLEWYLLRVVIFEETGFLFPVLVPWKQAAILSAAAVATATLAGLVPAFHAVRLRIAEAIAYE